ncbi:hydrogenase-4 component B [Aquipluma nitroreducens]|uniref:Hydrogenase-4 component B n=2 Tax=Aquipluma nitroreducens TaxID=2010828 RepID=A0A5K7SBZ7_9BACT|nr:hydrogenase-4 component B [Aquipluma nitroreducens]
MEMAGLLNLSWCATLVAIIALCFVSTRFKSYLAASAVIVNAIVTSLLAIGALNGEIKELIFQGNIFWGDILVRIDGLSAWFILIVNLTSVTGVIYGIGYLKPYVNSAPKLAFHWILFVIFHLSMVWVCMIQHSLAFLVAWEVMSLSSMLLVIFDYDKPKTIKAGINYLVQMHISVTFLTIGFIWVYFQTGSFSFDAFQTYFGANSNVWLFLIFFVGFGIKAGFIPLHSWLPHAHPAAPSHVSGVMSGVIVKLGIYGIFRIIYFLKADFLLLGEIVITISVLTGVYGILNAAVHRDFKRMLAYCTIENIGIIGICIGLGLMGMGNGSAILYYLGFGGALLHVLNHSLFKSLLFYSAGSIYQQTHTRDMDKLGGLIRQMPKTAVLFLFGAIAIGGLPPFNGFVSEFILYSGLLEGLKFSNISQISLLVVTLGGLSIIGGISVLTFTKTFGTIFLGNSRKQFTHQPVEVSSMMLVPQYLIVLVMLSVAFLPQFYLNTIFNLLGNLGKAMAIVTPSGLTAYSESITNINLYSILFIAIVAASWGLRALIMKDKLVKVEPTWGCAYVAPNSSMQYTGKSFSKSLGKIFGFLLVEEKKYKELEAGEIFPESRKYVSHYQDFFEFRIINYITHHLVYAANYFKFIQNGRVQSYVWYGIIFMVAIFMLTVLNVLK